MVTELEGNVRAVKLPNELHKGKGEASETQRSIFLNLIKYSFSQRSDPVREDVRERRDVTLSKVVTPLTERRRRGANAETVSLRAAIVG